MLLKNRLRDIERMLEEIVVSPRDLNELRNRTYSRNKIKALEELLGCTVGINCISKEDNYELRRIRGRIHNAKNKTVEDLKRVEKEEFKGLLAGIGFVSLVSIVAFIATSYNSSTYKPNTEYWQPKIRNVKVNMLTIVADEKELSDNQIIEALNKAQDDLGILCDGDKDYKNCVMDVYDDVNMSDYSIFVEFDHKCDSRWHSEWNREVSNVKIKK